MATALDPEAEALGLLWPLAQVGLDRKTRARRVGGKALRLAKLARDGYPVPPGWVLDARYFERVTSEILPKGHDVATLIKLAGTEAAVDRAARARDRILAHPLPDELKRALEALWRSVQSNAPWGLAVRSSATCEDADETSLAGLAESVLGVRGPAALEDAVRKVWASAVLPRALTYLAHAGLRDMAMAVVFQRMARAEAAGVLFTAPPPGLEGESWHADERLVTATFGLGAPVVDGAVAVDAIRFAREGGRVVSSVIVRKATALVVGPKGVETAQVPEHLQHEAALGPDALRQLSAVAERLESGGGAFDVEFAVEAGGDGARRVIVLQARPLTGTGFAEGGGADTVWSRTNVGEALPGAATPLTWSIARTFSDKGFREAFAALGCRVPRGAKLVGNVQGRFYLNLTEFMRIAAQVPGLTPRALLGVSGGASNAVIELLEKQAEDVSRKGFVARLPLTAPRWLVQHARLEGEVAGFEASAERLLRAQNEMDLSLLPDDALVTTLRGATRLLDRTGTLMLRTASGSLAMHLALSALLERVASRRASARGSVPAEGVASSGYVARLAQTLTGGVRELESAGPGLALSRVAELARSDRTARTALLEGRVQKPNDLPDGPTRRALEAFVEAFGDRAVREAELATPRWREDPRPVVAMLVASVRAAPGDADRALARARSLADRELASLETRLGTVELSLVRALVERTQRATRLRERMRTWVTRVLGLIRRIALDVDRRLVRIDPSLEPGSVFYCTYDELVAALSSGRAEVGHVVRLRRAEYLRDAARPDPPPTFVGRPPPLVLPPVGGTRLVGLPASSGVVEGTARVLQPGAPRLDTVQPGEILVSRTTDVGISPLFLVAAAVVTELGGPLSHAAIVAREYGIPAVVNVAGATAVVRTGDRLRVDGDRGVVEIVRPGETGAPPSQARAGRP